MKTLTKQALACVVIAGAAMPFSAFATNGYFAHGYGTKNDGLAGGGIALPQDAMIAATNPAGMVFVGERMDVGLALFHPSPRSYTVTGDPTYSAFGGGGFALDNGTYQSDNDNFFVPHFAYNWMLNPDSSAGITIYGNGGMNTEYPSSAHTFDPMAGAFTGAAPGPFYGGTAGVNLEQLFINGSYARKFAPNASYGVSVIFAYQTFEAKGLGAFGTYSSDQTNLTNNGKDTSTGFGLKLGVQGEVSPGLTAAASYQTKMSMSEFDKYKGLFAEKGGFDIPATLTLGVAWNATTTSAVTLDLQKIYYSKVASIANPISNLTTCAAADCLLGASNGAGFGWKDMTIVKLGYQFETSPDMTWRVGYSQGKQPIPDTETLFNILAPGVMETHFTFGFTKGLANQSEVNFAAMYAPEKSVSGKNAFDTLQTVDLKMKQYQLEVSYGKKF